MSEFYHSIIESLAVIPPLLPLPESNVNGPVQTIHDQTRGHRKQKKTKTKPNRNDQTKPIIWTVIEWKTIPSNPDSSQPNGDCTVHVVFNRNVTHLQECSFIRWCNTELFLVAKSTGKCVKKRQVWLLSTLLLTERWVRWADYFRRNPPLPTTRDPLLGNAIVEFGRITVEWFFISTDQIILFIFLFASIII